jgi:hypothetical protein
MESTPKEEPKYQKKGDKTQDAADGDETPAEKPK